MVVFLLCAVGGFDEVRCELCCRSSLLAVLLRSGIGRFIEVLGWLFGSSARWEVVRKCAVGCVVE